MTIRNTVEWIGLFIGLAIFLPILCIAWFFILQTGMMKYQHHKLWSDLDCSQSLALHKCVEARFPAGSPAVAMMDFMKEREFECSVFDDPFYTRGGYKTKMKGINCLRHRYEMPSGALQVVVLVDDGKIVYYRVENSNSPDSYKYHPDFVK